VSPAAVTVVGAGAAGSRAANQLRQANISDVIQLEREVVRSVFDDDTDTWILQTGAGTYRSRVVIAAEECTFVPWIPDLFAGSSFRGHTCHSTAWDPTFDPAGKRIAVVGVDTAGARLIDHLTDRAAAVQVFGMPPRRIVPVLTHRRTRTRRHHSPELVTALIESVTATGIRTRHGVDHDLDVIVYATGFSIRDGHDSETLVGARNLSIRKAWRDGMEPYAGVAVHGFPNYFWLTRADQDGQLHYIVECLRLLDRTNSARIEVRRSGQQVFNERVHLQPHPHHPVAKAFDVSRGADSAEHIYDGTATLTIDDTHCQVHVRLTGHVDPLDGRYHWQGTVFDQLPSDILRRTRHVLLDAGERSAPARITEQTPQGGHSVAGVGAPPFALDAAELAVPQVSTTYAAAVGSGKSPLG
jgi:cation diffusion facilitator CzcD-associated flavoprotein CzcO